MAMGSSAKTFSVLLLATLALAGCGSGQSDLLKYIDQVKAKPGGRIDPLPQIKPYEVFAYEAGNERSPFVPDKPAGRGAAAGPRPEATRPKEYLEQFSIDTLKMAGTLSQAGTTYGLVQTQDGLLHRVRTGNYVGQYDGRVVAVTNAEIQIDELVPDGVGGFYKRSAVIALD